MKKIQLLVLIILLSMACTLTNALPRPGQPGELTPPPSVTYLPTDTSTALMSVCIVTAEHLNLRSGPGTEFGSIAILNNDETVTILSEPAQGSSWAYVNASGREGWINQLYCKENEVNNHE